MSDDMGIARLLKNFEESESCDEPYIFIKYKDMAGHLPYRLVEEFRVNHNINILDEILHSLKVEREKSLSSD